jgi:hypothetical protein
VDRHENKKLTVDNHMQQLLNGKLVNEEGSEDQRQFKNIFPCNFNAPTALNIEQSLDGIILSQLLIDWFDTHTHCDK